MGIFIHIYMNESFGAKTCSGCMLFKTLDLFGKNKSKKDGLQYQCKECRKLSTKNFYELHKETQKNRVRKTNKDKRIEAQQYIIQYLNSHPCVDCNENNIVVLEFDHLKNKKYNVGDMIRKRCNLISIKNEIDKCEVRCANCHRKKTAASNNYYRMKPIVSVT